MKGWLKLHRFLIDGMTIVMAGLLLTASFVPAYAAERRVRFNIPACMS